MRKVLHWKVDGYKSLCRHCKKNLKLSLHANRAYGEVEVRLHEFLTSALDGGEWSSLLRGRFTRRGRGWAPDTVWIGSWMDPTAGLEAWEEGEIFCPYRESNHVQSLSWLLYQVMAKGDCHPLAGNLIWAIHPVRIILLILFSLFIV
jgi:hypothetical protein